MIIDFLPFVFSGCFVSTCVLLGFTFGLLSRFLK